MRTAGPTAISERIPSEMRRWVEGLHANMGQMFQGDSLQLSDAIPDDMLLLNFAIHMHSNASIQLSARGTGAYNAKLYRLRGPLRIVGVGPNNRIGWSPILLIMNLGRIPSLFLDNCTIDNWRNRNLPPDEAFASAVADLGEGIAHVRLTLPAGVTYAQMETCLITNEFWQPGPPGSPPTYTSPTGTNHILTYDVPNRRVSCRQQ